MTAVCLVIASLRLLGCVMISGQKSSNNWNHTSNGTPTRCHTESTVHRRVSWMSYTTQPKSPINAKMRLCKCTTNGVQMQMQMQCKSTHNHNHNHLEMLLMVREAKYLKAEWWCLRSATTAIQASTTAARRRRNPTIRCN